MPEKGFVWTFFQASTSFFLRSNILILVLGINYIGILYIPYFVSIYKRYLVGIYSSHINSGVFLYVFAQFTVHTSVVYITYRDDSCVWNDDCY